MEDELPLKHAVPSKSVLKNVDELMELMEEATSLDVVSAMLKSKQLTHSAGKWEDMKNKRILPALQKNDIDVSDLHKLLADAEENGRNHTFLYRCEKGLANRLIEKNRVSATARELGIEDLLKEPKISKKPSVPTFTEIRWDSESRGNCLVVKIVETREKRSYDGEQLTDQKLTKTWSIEQIRAVNTFRLFDSGLFEIKIQSNSNNSKDYSGHLTRLWRHMANPFFPFSDFKVLSLSSAKKKLWESRKENSNRVSFTDSLMRNDFGTSIQAATKGSAANLFDDAAATGSLDSFIAGGGHCDESNIWWLKQKDVLPTKDIHVMLSGQLNEFAVPGSCTKENYEFVFDQIAKLA